MTTPQSPSRPSFQHSAPQAAAWPPGVPQQRHGWNTPQQPPAPKGRRIPTVVVLVAVLLLGAVGGFLAGREFPSDGAVQRYIAAKMSEAFGRYSTGAPAQSSPANAEASSSAQVPTMNYTLALSGSAKGANVSWSYGGSSGSATTGVPWEKKVSIDGASTTNSTVSVSGVTDAGATGDLTCTITDADTGAVLKTQTARSDGGDYGYASVTCYVY